MKLTATLARCILASSMLAAVSIGHAQTASTPPSDPGSASQPVADNATMPECTQGLSDAEISLERGRQLVAIKRWKDALSPLREANSRSHSLAANCAALAVAANRLSETAATELRIAERSASHQTDCQPRLDKALDLDIRAATAKRESREASDIERLLADAESNWRDAASHCQQPHREKAERYLNSTIRARATNAELLSNSPACDSAWKNAGALGELAKGAWKDKHWDEAASLYHRAVMAWETASDNCVGSRQQQAQKKMEQTQLDAHNAEHCGPRWDSATELTQQAKSNAATASLAERDQSSVKAEVAWRNAVIFVEVALTDHLANNVQGLLDEHAPVFDHRRADTAIFYSISNTQLGLRGVSFGNFLLKRVIDDLKRDFPKLGQFATLSPMPGMAAWVRKNPEVLAEAGLDLPLDELSAGIWVADKNLVRKMNDPLSRLGARYLATAKQGGGESGPPADPVSRFHLGNGARVERINYLGDSSAKGLRQSFGLMVNYLYSPEDIETNLEAFATQGTIAMSATVRRLARSQKR